VLRAERVAREVSTEDPHGGEQRRTAWDCLVRLVRSSASPTESSTGP
jgi:hypothetical protein